MAKCGPNVVWFLSVIKGLREHSCAVLSCILLTVRGVVRCYGQFSKFNRNHTDRHIIYK